MSIYDLHLNNLPDEYVLFDGKKNHLMQLGHDTLIIEVIYEKLNCLYENINTSMK